MQPLNILNEQKNYSAKRQRRIERSCSTWDR